MQLKPSPHEIAIVVPNGSACTFCKCLHTLFLLRKYFPHSMHMSFYMDTCLVFFLQKAQIWLWIGPSCKLVQTADYLARSPKTCPTYGSVPSPNHLLLVNVSWGAITKGSHTTFLTQIPLTVEEWSRRVVVKTVPDPTKTDPIHLPLEGFCSAEPY